MLDAETKTKIDSARDILVGKVPNPKSQVEQITIALIYKFMDDMDRQSEELGGKASFFAGEFKKYRWAQLLDKRYSGHERLLLYAEGIEKMDKNKNIPQLFRDIFKGVFLPYRDPETLNLFLKEINGFTYDHSERLGDAFEYLLSVLGTQGEAGQFRTPRHIIDFIVDVVDPKKNETILDPACGSAGFLISAYKHILKQNENLTPDQRARLMTSFRGYDIAPDMVRLSRVNLYLHGFPNPTIHEYDTLTSEERWDERCDVILANPPFMTPKGGIRPHNRFSIKAKRSEVLFVDYMAEHLNPGGRAGIIVPEGIIFQSQNAYKALRKMLVEDFLWAVVSLPGGIFNPYAGVKTSILLLDRNLAKRSEDVLFVKIENDGFDLGAQRRPNGKNDLPEAREVLERYKKTPQKPHSKKALAVPRRRVLESTDINLAGDRYRISPIRTNGKWPRVKLGPYTSLISSGITPLGGKDNYLSSGILFIRSQNVLWGNCDFNDAVFISKELHDQMNRTHVCENDVLLNITGASIGRCSVYKDQRPANVNQHVCIIRPNKEIINSNFLSAIIISGPFQKLILQIQNGASRQALNFQQIREFEIPLPPLDEQERIVAELEGYRKVIEGARQILTSYKPNIRIDPKWPTKTIGEIADLEYGLTATGYEKGNIRLIRITDITEEGMLSSNNVKFTEQTKEIEHYLLNKNDLLVARTGATYGKALLFESVEPSVFASYLIRLRFVQDLLPKFFWLFTQTDNYWSQARLLATGGGQPQFNGNALKQITVPIPHLEIQNKIVKELEGERKLVEANRELITRMEAKTKAKLAEVWGENTPTEGEAEP